MSGRTHFKQIQGSATRDQGPREYMKWENLIFDETGVSATVRVDLKAVSIRTESYADYCVAAAFVRKRTSLEVVRG